jgi:hypothetical protein
MNWDDPTDRAALIERVGPDEYNRLIEEHHESSTVARINGYRIRPVGSRFGTVFVIDGAGFGFATQAKAEAHARTLPERRPQ